MSVQGAGSSSATCWDDYARQHLSSGASTNRAEWLGHPLVRQRHLDRRNGKGLAEWFVDDVLGGATVSSGLGLGVGAASFELRLLELGAVESFELYEMAPAMTELADERARAIGVRDRVEFRNVDMNEVDPPAASFDLVTFISSLHHVTQLSRTIRLVHAALRPQGLLFASEYIGPNRFQFPREHNGFSRALYETLPPELTCGLPELPQPRRDEVMHADPSEAVHSAEIEATLRRAFAQVEVFSLGGCLPFTIWWGLDHDALYDTGQGMALVDLICRLDELLTESGVVPTYFADIVARVGESSAERAARPIGGVDPETS